MKPIAPSVSVPNQRQPWARLLLACAIGVLPVACATPISADSILGCYALEENGKADVDFHSKDGVIRWSVRRERGWVLQPDVVELYQGDRRHPGFSAETFDKIDAMLDAGDMYFLIKFKKDRIQDVQGGSGREKAIEEFKRAKSPYLISLNARLATAYRVPCNKERIL